MKKIFFILAFFILPFPIFADETSTSTVTVNIRYQDSLVWSGPVELTKSSSVNIIDNAGENRTIISDSALAALKAADTLSDNFTLSDLIYYSDFDSLYVRCIDIISPQTHACDNWQYVVNSTYLPVGMDKQVISTGDVLYFYFGKARRVTLSSTNVEAAVPVTAKVESYDYINNAWNALSGVSLGATQPNPNDPYSPLVISSVTSDENGLAQLILNASGSYNIGLAMDYYFPGEPLSVLEPVAKTTIQTEPPAPETTNRSGGRSSSRGESNMSNTVTNTLIDTPNTITELAVKQETVEKVEATKTDSIVVSMNIEMDSFLKKYEVALHNQKININNYQKEKTKPVFVVPQSQISNVVNAVKPNEAWLGKTFSKILNIFGFN